MISQSDLKYTIAYSTQWVKLMDILPLAIILPCIKRNTMYIAGCIVKKRQLPALNCANHFIRKVGRIILVYTLAVRCLYEKPRTQLTT